MSKRIYSIFAITFLMPAAAFAQEESHTDLFESIIGTRVRECREHFDLEPYILIAVGAQPDDRITEETIQAISEFADTGRLRLPKDKEADPIAQSCATYAEGLLAGGLAHQFVSAVGEALAEMLADAVQKALDAVTKGEEAETK